VLADCCQRGVRVIAITQQIDLSGPVGNLIASLLFGIAEIELHHSKERQAIGVALAKNAVCTQDAGRAQQRQRRPYESENSLS
jgi:DNA invertase Pin-like site-specific DNA recombinase